MDNTKDDSTLVLKIDLLDVCQEFLLESGDFGRFKFVQVTSDAAVDDSDLLFNGHRNCG